jgi:PIN domain nuclease of toxin-antitoxin system
MRVLLDTHTFIWWDTNPDKLSNRAMDLCKDPGNEILLSVVSLWKIQIKLQIDKIRLRVPLPQMVMGLLPIEASHIFLLATLPSIHKDPFDRLLAAQTKAESLLLVTRDSILRKYPINVEW